MPTLAIESNGRLERTAIYFNGQQVGGVKELYLNLDEDGTFDNVIQYEGTDGKIRSKQIFSDYLDNIKLTEPSFTEEDSEGLQLLSVESDGDVESAAVFINDEPEDGIVSLFLHIKSSKQKESIVSKFVNRNDLKESDIFRAEITFRYEDGSKETEEIF